MRRWASDVSNVLSLNERFPIVDGVLSIEKAGFLTSAPEERGCYFSRECETSYFPFYWYMRVSWVGGCSLKGEVGLAIVEKKEMIEVEWTRCSCKNVRIAITYG